MVTASPNTTPHPTAKRYDPYTCTQAAVYAQPAQVLTPDCRGVMIYRWDSQVPSRTRILDPVISSNNCRLVVDNLTINQVTLSIITNARPSQHHKTASHSCTSSSGSPTSTHIRRGPHNSFPPLQIQRQQPGLNEHPL
jgi:hypothetical protein